MRLVCAEFGIDTVLLENKALVITIEQAHAFQAVTRELWNQLQGENGPFILSEGEKEMKISQKMAGIFNPYALDCNDRKILAKLYRELEERSREDLLEAWLGLCAQQVSFLDMAVSLLPYNLAFDESTGMSALFKCYGLRIESRPESLLESVIDYLRASRDILGVTVAAFVNIKQFLSAAEVEELYRFCFYRKIHLILFERTDFKKTALEHKIIIDEDLCLIDIE